MPDAVAVKSEDAKDADFCYSESNSKSSRRDVEVTPKKPRGRPRNDTPCEKCGLHSHAATVIEVKFVAVATAKAKVVMARDNTQVMLFLLGYK